MVASRPRFRESVNIALKMPADRLDATIRFYRDVLGFPTTLADDGQAVVELGNHRLWLDPLEQRATPEIWLEVATDDLVAAEAYLAEQGFERRDGLEPLPEGFPGFWIESPAGVVHLVTGDRR